MNPQSDALIDEFIDAVVRDQKRAAALLTDQPEVPSPHRPERARLTHSVRHAGLPVLVQA